MADEKLYRIGEVATLLNLKTSVLRFWESEFPAVSYTHLTLPTIRLV